VRTDGGWHRSVSGVIRRTYEAALEDNISFLASAIAFDLLLTGLRFGEGCGLEWDRVLSTARIIQAHVKDGVEMAEKHKLALPILKGIAEHHGTSVIRYFYEKAKELADPEKGDLVAEHDYRYHGPKPQTREAGILMLADSVEAASRTLVDSSPARVQQLVQRIINNYFRDGQLDDCSLTLRDLHSIARSFIETLSAIRHERIDYPAATDAFGRKMEEGADEGPSEREPRSGGRSEGAREKREDDLRRLGLD